MTSIADKPWVHNSIWYALIAWGLTLSTIPFGAIANDAPSLLPVLLYLIFLPIAAFTFIALILSVVSYPTTERFLRRLLHLYLALILVFATTYFWIVVAADFSELAIYGVHSPWQYLPGAEGRQWHANFAALTAVDCFHYSCVTITTLGFGDMHPVHWFPKLVTDVEVLSGVTIVAVGLGRFFARNDP